MYAKKSMKQSVKGDVRESNGFQIGKLLGDKRFEKFVIDNDSDFELVSLIGKN